jgi:EamA domain-containing membrane protein RarD
MSLKNPFFIIAVLLVNGALVLNYFAYFQFATIAVVLGLTFGVYGLFFWKPDGKIKDDQSLDDEL